MKTKHWLLPIIFFIPFNTYPQDSPLLEWNEFYELQWHDFEGQPTTSSIGDAGAAVKIKARPYYEGNEIHFDVRAYFDRQKSWSRDRSTQLLRHEQLHFDIAELYARKIRRKIAALQREGQTDIKVYNREIRLLMDESNNADIRYDAETLHGSMLKRQRTWEESVARELDDLNDYKRKKRVISTKN